MVIQDNLSIKDKLAILSDAAKYDVSCSSSGVDRAATPGKLGDCAASGICHTFTGDGRCISLLKILFTNECIYDCKYCINRSSNDVVRTSFTPEEVCTLTMEFYKRNFIEGLFLSSGIMYSPNYTMEQICKTLIMLRDTYEFQGYIHVKTIPGADPSLIEMAGWYADRMSVNLELPTAEGLHALAPHKSRKNILTPMRQIQNGIDESREELGFMGGNRSAYWHTRQKLAGIEQQKQAGLEQQKQDSALEIRQKILAGTRNELMEKRQMPAPGHALGFRPPSAVNGSRGFAVAGQSTQMIIGATQETDWQIIQVAEALYKNFDLKRVCYSAFVKVNQDSTLPDLPGGPPLLREHRLYQADWLFRYYGFQAEELLSERQPNFSIYLDPKCDWAMQHLDEFPVEVSKAEYFHLLRIPGVGPKSARRIVTARRQSKLSFEALKKFGVVLKRAKFFLTCNGKMMPEGAVNEECVRLNLMKNCSGNLPKGLSSYGVGYQQLSLFDSSGFSNNDWSLVPTQPNKIVGIPENSVGGERSFA